MNLFKSASHFSLFYLLFATIIMVNKDFQKYTITQTKQQRLTMTEENYREMK